MMKKYLLLMVFAGFCIAASANVFSNSRIPDWDRGLYKKTVTYPEIEGLYVDKSYLTGNLEISFSLSDWVDNRTWKTTIAVRTYTRLGFNNWQWVTILYDVYVAPETNYGSSSFVIPSYNQYVWSPGGDPGPSGDWLVDGSQVYIAFWGPM